MPTAFQVLHPGILTAYQDLGRSGFRKYGIPVSGAMDRLALRVANLLVGNEENAVGLEVTLQGLSMVTLAPVAVAVTGADLHFTVNSTYCPPWGTLELKAGDRVQFKKRESGFRAYLAVRGGFRAPAFLGSGSVFQRGSMGAPLRRNDVLELAQQREGGLQHRLIPEKYQWSARSPVGVRAVLGPQTDAFTDEGLETFLSSSYRIKPQSDRMAYRLEGPLIAHRGRADIISEPVLPGSIQVPSDGLPIVLMAEGQVTGGYTKIGNVISADMPLLAQAMPGEYVRFATTDLDSAYQALEEREQVLRWIRGELSGI